MKHKNFTDDYNEIMYDERNLIYGFLKDRNGIISSKINNEYKLLPPVQMVSKYGTNVECLAIKEDKDDFVLFDVKGEDWRCYDFAYGELSRVIDVLPDLAKKPINEIKDIMDEDNGHATRLVEMINKAWASEERHDLFGGILLAILCRDHTIYEQVFGEIEDYSEGWAMTHAHEILEHVCDDWDLECVLKFVGYEDK